MDRGKLVRSGVSVMPVDRCPVVDASGVVVGFISPSDLMRARFREQPLIGEETLR